MLKYFTLKKEHPLAMKDQMINLTIGVKALRGHFTIYKQHHAQLLQVAKLIFNPPFNSFNINNRVIKMITNLIAIATIVDSMIKSPLDMRI